MELDRVKILIDKYLEAETTLDEERELAKYFATADSIPEEYEPLRVMFASTQRVKANVAPQVAMPNTPKPKWWYRYAGIGAVVAAACLIMVLLIPAVEYNQMTTQPATIKQPKIVCHVDGVRVTDSKMAVAEANKILGNVSNNMELAMAELDKLNLKINR